jgi:putative MATE family efflux protein
MLSNALQVLYSTIDMIIVGAFVGTAGLSAVSQSSQIINFAVMICLGFSNAGQVLVAQALGAKKKKEMSEIIGTLFCFVTLVSLIFSVVMIILAKPILTAMNVPIESYDMAYDYIIISSIGLFFTAGYNMVSAVLRGMGDGKRPLLFIGIASGVNLVLDIIFVGPLNMSVAGAAWATIIGQAVSFIFSLFYLYKRKEAFGFDFKRESFRMKKNYSMLILKLGTPMAIQSGFINISMMFVNAMINDVGLVESATFGVGVRIDDIINKLCHGIQFAAMPIISQNDGAGNTSRMKGAVKWAIIYSSILTVIFMLLYLFLGEEMFRLFSDDPLVHDMSHVFITAILWMFPAFAIMRGSGAFIQGIGHAKLCMALAMLDGVVLRIGLSWLFGTVLGWGFYGYVLGYGLAPYGYAIPSMLYFLFGKWQNRRSISSEI